MPNIERRNSSSERKGQKFKKFSESPLSEERFGDHLAAYGNHEGKAGLLAKMKLDVTYTQGPLAGLVNPNEKQLWRPNVPIAWCRVSLAPCGLVASELTDSKRITTYKKTQDGENLGEAFGGQLLDLSENLPVSLYQLSGSTMSPKTKIHETEEGERRRVKNRAPLTRFRIAKTLVTSELPMREKDLIVSLQTKYPDSYESFVSTKSLISAHLCSLKETGLIIYKSKKADVSYSFYSPVTTKSEDSLEPYNNNYSLTHRVYGLLSQAEKPLSIQDVYEALVQQHPDYRSNKQDSLTGDISHILAYLAREGYAINEGFRNEVKSTITLTSSQKEALTRFVDLGEKFRSLDPDFLEEGREKARAIVDDKERFNALMEKAYKASKYTQMTDTVETGKKILAYVKDNPRATNNDVKVYLQKDGSDIGIHQIRKITSSLRAAGKLTGEQEKTQLYYSVPEKFQSFTEEKDIFPSATQI